MYHSVGRVTVWPDRSTTGGCMQGVGQTTPESKAALWGWVILGVLVVGTCVLNASGNRSRA